MENDLNLSDYAPLDLHEQSITGIEGFEDHPELKFVASAFKQNYERMDNVGTYAKEINANGSLTENEKKLRIGNAANKACADSLISFGKLREQLEKKVTDANGVLNKEVTAKGTNHLQATIVNRFFEFNIDKKHTLLTKAINDLDHTTVTAILSAPVITTGLTSDEKIHYRDFYNRKANPFLFSRKVMSEKILDRVERRSVAFTTNYQKISGVNSAELERLRADDKKLRDAESALKV